MARSIRFLFIVIGLINLAPIIGVLGASRLEALYGTPMPSGDLLLLLRHRAVLLAIVGGLLLYAAVAAKARAITASAAFVSMLSFIVLIALDATAGAALVRVAWIDGAACLLLATAVALDRRRLR